MVEWKKLGEVCLLKARIGWQGLTQKEHRTTGEYLLVTGTDFTSNYEVDFDHCVYVDEERYTQDPNIQLRENDVLITKDGTLGKMAVIENLPKPATLNGGLFVIRDLTGKIHHKYLLHYMLSSKFQSIIESNHTNGTIKHLTQALLTNFPIPIPSLEKQLEIVRILDTFTSSIENLKEQIAQRRKQYEYYRDQLLDLEGKEGVDMKTLGSFAEIGTGSSNTQDELEKGKYPFFVRSQIVRWKNEYEFDEKAIITSGDGVGVGKVLHYYEGRYALHQRAYRIHIVKNTVLPKYLFYFMQKDFYSYIMSNAYAASVTSVRKPMLINYPIPIPSLSEQQRIVSILDTFEASINNLEQQLAQREKQYEYYRNKLLIFE